MFENMNEQEARDRILEMVGEYCDKFHNQDEVYREGDRIPYASRVYDHEEMENLVDELFQQDEPNYTPDGKVIVAIFPHEALEKLFK